MEYSRFEELFVACLSANHQGRDEWSDSTTVELFYRLTEHMLRVNADMNLTAITDPVEIVLRHYMDSLTLLPYIPMGARLLDVGCGAGFPSLPLALARKDIAVTSLDSSEKKVRYVNQTAELLGISNRLQAISARAEDAAAPSSPYRESFDVVTGRAVARLPILTELCVPFLKPGGVWIAMKGGQAALELKEAKHAYEVLGLAHAELIPCRIAAPQEILRQTSSESPEEHALVIARKVRKTPEIYPRKYARILKKPL